MEVSIHISVQEPHLHTWVSLDGICSLTHQSDHRHKLMPYAFGHFNDSIASEPKDSFFFLMWKWIRWRGGRQEANVWTRGTWFMRDKRPWSKVSCLWARWMSDCSVDWCISHWKQEVAGGEEVSWLDGILVFSIFLLTLELHMFPLLCVCPSFPLLLSWG